MRAILVGLIMGLVMVMGAMGADISSCPYTINESGSYAVTTDINLTGNSTCITIEASDVYLNGQDNTIAGDNSTQSYGILGYDAGTQHGNITIERMVFADLGYGIQYKDLNDTLLIRNVTMGTIKTTPVRIENTQNGGGNVGEFTLYNSGITLDSQYSGNDVIYLSNLNKGYVDTVTVSVPEINGSSFVYMTTNASTVTTADVRDCSFTATSYSDNGNGVKIDATADTATTYDNVDIVDNYMEGMEYPVFLNGLVDSSITFDAANVSNNNMLDILNLQVYNCQDCLINDNVLNKTSVGVASTFSFMIDLKDSTDVSVLRNTVSGSDGGNPEFLIRCRDTSCEVADNTLEYGFLGIECRDCDNSSIHGNTLTDIDQNDVPATSVYGYGIRLRSTFSNVSVYDNSVTSNYGLIFHASSTGSAISVYDNNFTSANNSVLFGTPAATLTTTDVYQNNFISTNDAISGSNASTVNFTSNYYASGTYDTTCACTSQPTTFNDAFYSDSESYCFLSGWGLTCTVEEEAAPASSSSSSASGTAGFCDDAGNCYASLDDYAAAQEEDKPLFSIGGSGDTTLPKFLQDIINFFKNLEWNAEGW